MGQENWFVSSEGDAWFRRNMDRFESIQSSQIIDWICLTLAPFEHEISSILEVGSASGSKLNSLCARLSAVGYGVDPSLEAVQHGKAMFLDLELHHGTADDLPFGDTKFDLVYFGFCLYLVSRSKLMRAIAEADRVLRSGGFLAILDFDPGVRYRVPYQHAPGVFSYKQSYADVFVATGGYYLVSKFSLSHDGVAFSSSMNDRVSVTILFKEPESGEITIEETA